jgi:competence protein ComEA
MTQPLRFVCHLRGAIILSWLFTLLLAAGASAATKKPPLQPINLNAATSEELQQVPGIGPATADKILQMRKSYGAFKSVDDLLAIRGIGKKRLDKMRKYLTTGKPAPASAKKSPLGQPATCNACKDVVPPAKAATLNSSANAPPKKAAPPPAPTQDDEDEEPE